jgi:teichuronic acid exporter
MLRSIATVLRGSVVAQGIGFLILPVLSRLYSPEAFGHYQLFQSTLMLLILMAALRYEVALLRAADGPEITAVFRLCLLVNLSLFGLVAAALISFFALGWPAAVLELPFPLWLIPVAILFGGTAQTLTYVVTRAEAYGASANSKIAQSVTFSLVALAIGAVSPMMSGLIYADVAARVVLAVYLLAWSARQMPVIFAKASRALTVAAASKYRDLPLFTVPSSLTNMIGSIMAPILIYAIYSPEESGQFGLVDRSFTVPLALVVTAVSQVFTARFASELRASSVGAVSQFRQLVAAMAALGVIPALILVGFGPTIFITVFGPQWALAGEFARMMAPAYWLSLIFGAVNMTLLLLERQRLQMAWEVGRLMATISLWLAVWKFGLSVELAIAGHALIMSISSIIFLFLSYKALQHHARPGEAANAADLS